jgi:hypothetical protein
VISAVIGFAAGFIGGRSATHLTTAPAAALIQTQDFQLVDQAGRVRGHPEPYPVKQRR